MKQLNYDSPEAAQIKTITGWVGADGRFWGEDEHMARWSACTHIRCKDCGAYVEKSWLLCEGCRQSKSDAKWAALPRQKWDGETPLALYDDDRFFFSEEDLEDYCDAHDVKAGDLRLVLCHPAFATPIDPVEHYLDFLPEDADEGDIPRKIMADFDALNKAIAECAEPLSWMPTNIAVEIGI